MRLLESMSMSGKKGWVSIYGDFLSAFAAFGGVLFGYDTGTISGIMAMNYVKGEFPANKESFTSKESSLIVSILSAGTLVRC